MDAVHVEGMAIAAKHSGGARAIMEELSSQRQAVKGALKCVYWLAKEETAHYTKFPCCGWLNSLGALTCMS